MDITDINKVASRKRMNLEAEKLREKVSRETAKIIKLKVAQDTAYWDLKEKLHQLENNHERLQQNMVEVQMEHETISGQYQDELRLRPETLNKVTSTREICDVLEDYSTRLKETLSRCKADQGALCDAYQKSGAIVKEIKTRQTAAEERNRVVVAGLEEKLQLSSEHQSQLVQCWTSSQQQYESQCAALRAHAEEAARRAADAARDLALLQARADTKDKNIASLQNEMKRLLHEFNVQANDMKNTITKQEKELSELLEHKETLEKGLNNQEQFSKSLCEQNGALQEKISSHEEEAAKLYSELAALQAKLEDITTTCNILRRDVASLSETKESLENSVQEKTQLLNNAAKEIERLISDMNTMQIEKASVTADLAKSNQDNNEKNKQIEECKSTVKGLEAKVSDLEKCLQDCRLTNDEKIKVLNETIENKHNENTSKGETINKLINEIKMCMEVRNRLETNIDKMKKEIEVERERAIDIEMKYTKQVEQLQRVANDKEQELSKQMTIILEIRGEKEKLQSKISGMQNTIDNIQKELTGRPAARPADLLAGDQPELDDNAVSLTPRHQSQERPQKCSQFAVPARSEPKQADMLFNIFSDSSMDGDALDPEVVNRRFEAISRGESVPRTSLAALKRRRAPTLASKHVYDESPISLSQVRNEAKSKGNTFFRTKRAENKLKRFKKIDDLEAQ